MSSVIESKTRTIAPGDDSWHASSVPKRRPFNPRPYSNEWRPPTAAQLASVAARLKYARELRDVDMNPLGRKAGLKTGHVSRIESGQRGADPNKAGGATYRKLAEVLRIDRDWLETGKSKDGRIFLDQPAGDADLRERVAALTLQVGAILKAAEIPDPAPLRLRPRRLTQVPPKR